MPESPRSMVWRDSFNNFIARGFMPDVAAQHAKVAVAAYDEEFGPKLAKKPATKRKAVKKR